MGLFWALLLFATIWSCDGYSRKGGTKSSFHGVPMASLLGRSRKINLAPNCAENPMAPINSEMRCTLYTGCQVTCLPGHQFPNGEISLVLICKDNEWIVDQGKWETIPSCEPICMPQCENNGICISPNRCQCSESFAGPQCQYENKPCFNYPPLPLNSRRTCSSTSCTVSCLKGHEFPDGSSIANLKCVNGAWITSHDRWQHLPDCQATCVPRCMNGGRCLSLNTCQCPQDFRGPQCQYKADICNAKRMGFNGGYNCSGNAEYFECSIKCPDGIQFEFPPSSTYRCSYATGVFMPQPIPQCVYDSSVNVIPLGSSSETFYKRLSSHSYSAGQYPMVIPDLMGESTYWKQTGSNYWGVKKTPQKMITSSNIGEAAAGFYSSLENMNVSVQMKLPKPENCYTWGGAHYKTFDGAIYSFESPCTYNLLRDIKDNTFSISIKNGQSCHNFMENAFDTPGECSRKILIYLGDRKYELGKSSDGFNEMISNGKPILIPGQVPGMRVEQIGDHLEIILDSVGAKVRWDGALMVQVQANEALWNRTGGLCGLLDGNIANDFLSKDRTQLPNLMSFLESWKVDTLGEPACSQKPVIAKKACEDSPKDAEAADRHCRKLLENPKFQKCITGNDLGKWIQTCKRDYCDCRNHDPQKCACRSVEVFVRDCKEKGKVELKAWRDQEMCPLICTGGRTYSSCGPRIPPTCGSALEATNEASEDCEEGCFCPQGMLLHEGKCVEVEKCPCRLRGKEFRPGHVIPKDCNTCLCQKGKWECSKVDCGARCSAIGDPHYQTFDGRRYDFMGQCSYTLLQTEDYTVDAENVPCAGSISQAMNLPMSLSGGLPSCTKSVTIKIPGEHIIKLKQGREISVNGKEVLKLPYDVESATIRTGSSIFLVVELLDGVEIWWDGVTRVYIDVPASFKGKTKGLCGTFNANQEDDFLTPEGDVEKSVIPFANKWKTKETCKDLPNIQKSHPCEINIQNKELAEKHCAKLKSEIFANCHWYVNPDTFYADCLFDVCSCETELSDCLCPILASYGAECAAISPDAVVPWRDSIRECGITCPNSQTYQACGDSCTRSCLDISLRPKCKSRCVEGCNCPEGLTLNEMGDCVPISTCPCRQDGLEFPPGYKEIRPGTKSQQLCTCSNALWDCTDASPEEIMKYPKSSDLKAVCSPSKHQEFTTCEPVDPKTCRNMHNFHPTTPAICRPGCKCQEGFVLDSYTKTCVRPTSCPCHHGGKSYNEADSIQNDCNTCECHQGKWRCTERECPGQCSAWGDSHFKTFDGKEYDFQGQCDYILAKGSLGKDEAFDIIIQSVPCSTLGTACSKAVTIKVGSETLTLTKEKPIPELAAMKRMAVRSSPQLVIVEVEDLGLVVHWDRGTRVYVRLDPKWKERIKGLCGNYNGDQNDDFQTPAGGISEVSTAIFGDSWKLASHCPQAKEVVDTCSKRPERRAWAQRKCGILKSPPFSSCHSEVPIDSWLERCIFDTCACDQGGDCECLCTALAAYVHECNLRGVPIKWRSQKLCPMQCDEQCSHYVPCMSTCPPKTCDTALNHAHYSKLCAQDVCVEGCLPRPCPNGYVRLNSTSPDCIPLETCPRPICMEIPGIGTVFEGDVLEEDDCHKCHCSLGKKICKGEPCTTTLRTTKPPKHMHEAQLQCVSGWSKWFNQEVHRPNSKGEPSDVEPVLSLLILNQLQGARCPAEKMTEIQCRTVKTHQDVSELKDSGLDVECSLERGLVCTAVGGKGRKMCPDFETRIFCQCEEPTEKIIEEVCDPKEPNREHPSNCHLFLHCVPGFLGPELVEKSCGSDMMYNPSTQTCDWPNEVISIKPTCAPSTTTPLTYVHIHKVVQHEECPPGLEFSHCAIECERMCLYHDFLVKSKGMCVSGQACEKGCVSAEKKTSCPKGMLWRDAETCVHVEDCSCRSHDGKQIRPGTVYRESDCEICQCIDNHYVCDKSACAQPLTTPALPDLEFETVPPEFIIKTTVTPPAECSGDLFIDLIEGDIPLNDGAFSASSVLSDAYGAKSSRFTSGINDDSAGSWSPLETNKQQYLQVIFPEIEPVYGVVLKGSPLYDEYVTSYHVLHSTDGLSFEYIPSTENVEVPKIFRGNLNPKEPSKQLFDHPIEMKAIRISPQTWHNNIAVKLQVLGCQEETPTGGSMVTIRPLCSDKMGVDNGLLRDSQIFVSSEKIPGNKKNLKLSSKDSWRPLTNSPTEWVKFDFMEPRNITGIETKGGPNGWVSAYAVEYSHDNKIWNPILDDYSNEKVFLGNFDKENGHTTYFDRPLQTKYLKVEPKKWTNNIEMKIEPLGCYKPYPPPAMDRTIQIVPPVLRKCNICPDVPLDPREMNGKCKCEGSLHWNGLSCVPRPQCPCFVKHVPYSIGTVFEKEDCSQCICTLGGVAKCDRKKCDKCPDGMRSIVTGTCGCICKPCPEGKKLCHTSEICIDEALWCNGVQDCPDDEIGCPTTTPFITTTLEPPIRSTKAAIVESTPCPPVECPPGYKIQLKKDSKAERYHQYLSPMFYSYSGRKTATKSGYASKGGKYQNSLPRNPAKMDVEIIKEETKPACEEFKCVPPKWTGGVVTKPECPVPTCPDGYKVVYELGDMKNPMECKRYECKPPPPQDSTCDFIGKTFTTFDGTVFKYDICEHLLARDLETSEWELILVKNCNGPTNGCSNELVIKHADEVVVLYADLSLEYNGYKYTVDQTKKIGAKNKSFVISRLGGTLLFVSNHYGFWVMWDQAGNVKVGVSNKLIGKVDGLCGFYNRLKFDDKRKPDGKQARTSVEFGDSWSIGNKNCDVKTCQMKKEAWEMCNLVKKHSLAPCHAQTDVEQFVSRCFEIACDCLETTTLNATTKDWCRCQVLEAFVMECYQKKPDVELNDWRVIHECPADCPAPLVHHDCYRRRCEPSCKTLSDPDACPVANGVCFPGCYCPPGTVRKKQACVPARECRDCECNVLPNLKYVQFDGENVTVDTNCSYVMVQDKVTSKKGSTHEFSIIVTNAPCAQNPDKMCPDVITINYGKKAITIQRSPTAEKFVVEIDSAEVMHLPLKSDWIEVQERAAKHINILLPNIQMEFTAYYPTLGASVKLPSHTYAGKIEGLCGNCNRDKTDDKRKPDGSIPETLEEFTHSWLSGDAKQCFRENLKDCEAPEKNPCQVLLDEERFGQCHMLLSPAIFLETCLRDICGNRNEQACISLETYAVSCSANGLCVDWHTKECPAKKCPSGQTYELCGSACAPTCENYKTVKTKKCPPIPTEGCFCPPGLVKRNGTCVESRYCEICDSEGHHPGDKWQVDACTSCKCVLNCKSDKCSTQIRCETQNCPALDTVCEQGFTTLKVEASEKECCPKYLCVPAATISPTCEPPQKLNCGPGQVMKLDTTSDGCQKFVCQCKPPEDCDPLKEFQDIPVGMERVVDKSGCCPIANLVCRPEKCPKAKPCSKFYVPKKSKGPNDCCYTHTCEPPPDKCLYELSFLNGANGGERSRTNLEKELIAKNLDDQWQDGPCRNCKCLQKSKGLEASCRITECPQLNLHIDKDDYDLLEQPIRGECCPGIKRVKCKHHGKLYDVGKSWLLDGDPCKTVECVETALGIQKQTKVKTCDTNCELGWRYEPPAPPLNTQQCCGTCKAYACAVNGKIRQVGETWTSPDHCTKYTCKNLNGSIQVSSQVETCPELTDQMKEDFVYEITKKDGQCCKEFKQKACKVGNKEYKVGETWPSPKDKCKTITCVSHQGELTKQSLLKQCLTDCAEGWVYKPAPASSKECCGECEPFACVANGTLKKPNEEWKSEDGCTLYSCNWQGKILAVTTSRQTCPNIDNCPLDAIYSDGCCEMCNATVLSQINCSPVEMLPEKSAKIIKFARAPHGLCWNPKPIPGFNECKGQCHSATLYNPKTYTHETNCGCCQAVKYSTLNVDMECQDGYKFKKIVTAPSECSCEVCTSAAAIVAPTKH